MSVLNALPGQTGPDFARLIGQSRSSEPLARVPKRDTRWLDDGQGDWSSDPSQPDRPWASSSAN